MKITGDAREHTTSQHNGPLPHIREVFWVAWVSFVKFYLLKVSLLGCSERGNDLYNYWFLVLRNVGGT